MRKTIAILLVLAALAPFILFQGDPALMPAFLARRYAGVPGTMLLITGGFGLYLLLCWAIAFWVIADDKDLGR